MNVISAAEEPNRELILGESIAGTRNTAQINHRHDEFGETADGE